MALQYISDDAGNHTAVIIPIKQWDHLTAAHQDLRQLENAPTISPKPKFSDFKGCISKETALKMISDIESNRNEWERNF